ncbi:hypothetical protein [Streptomyces europaeiscabiei]|uniref:hypothetical protein n=1 Tax=Streptomyces europaeiscabiei TaxID=146819 RepID=UPI0039A3FFE3
MSDAALSSLRGTPRFGMLVTVKRGGRPYLTTMLYSRDPRTRVVRVALAEGEAEVSAITTIPGDAVGHELLG